MAEEFYSFTEALKHLRLKEEELKRLVSEGEIRAFRDGDTMKLRRADVENLKTELLGGEVVDLGGAGEDLVFEDDADLGDAGMATEEITEMDTLLDEDVEDVGEIDLEEEEDAGAVAVACHPEHGYVVKWLARRGDRTLSLVSLNETYPPLELVPGAGALLGPVVLRWCSHRPAKPRVAPGP